MLELLVKHFDQLSTNELYDILHLRSEVFVVEQNCVYQDLDRKDKKALHLFFVDGELTIAYARLFAPGDYFEDASIGRILVHKEYRSKNIGHKLMTACIESIQENYKTSKITISAQKYLKSFYESHGFNHVGVEYLEDGIPHIRMLKI